MHVLAEAALSSVAFMSRLGMGADSTCPRLSGTRRNVRIGLTGHIGATLALAG